MPHSDLGPARDPEEILAALDATLNRIAELGIRLHPQSRFRVYHRTLQDAAAGRPLDMAVRSQAHLEVSQLLSIGRHLLKTPCPVILGKLRQVMSGRLVPQESEGGTPERDTQYELLLAGLLVGGALRIHFEEPDLVVESESLFIGIAAKRMKSWEQLEKRLNEARDQLLRRRDQISHGMIALDITAMTNPGGLIAWSEGVPGRPSAAETMTEMVEARVEEIGNDWMRDGFDRVLVGGVLLFGSMVHYLPKEGGVICSGHFSSCGFNPNTKYVRDRLQAAVRRARTAD